MASDFELLEAWKAGDDASGNLLVRRHFERIYMFFDSKVGGAVEDLTQRTFLACTTARDRIDPQRSFRTYLYGIARNQLLQYYTRLRRDSERDDLWQRSADEAFETPSQMVARHDEQRLLLKALRSIPLELQIAVELFYWEEMPLADIANVVEIPEGTVKSRLHRAKLLLREKVLELAASPEIARTTMDDFERWARSLRKPEE